MLLTDHIIELSFLISLLINAMLFIPQIMRLLANKDSKELSFITFFGFWLINLVTALHGFITKDYLLAYGTILSLITGGLVVWLIVYYRYWKKG